MPVRVQLAAGADNSLMGMTADAVPLGRITMELKADVTPKTAENFVQLAQADPGNGFALSRFHRVIPNFMCQVRDRH